MSEIGDSGWHLNALFYHYQVWDRGWVSVATPLHPNERGDDVEIRSPNVLDEDKPTGLYDGNDLLWAIRNAESLDDLEQAVLENRKHIDPIDIGEEQPETGHRTTEAECPKCTGLTRCDYHEGVRHGREQYREVVWEILEFGEERVRERRDEMMTGGMRQQAMTAKLEMIKWVQERLNDLPDLDRVQKVSEWLAEADHGER